MGFRASNFPWVVKHVNRLFGADASDKHAAQQHAYKLAFVTEFLLEKLPQFALVAYNAYATASS